MGDFLEKSGLLRAVIDAMPLPVFVIDRGFCILDSNSAGAKLLESAGTEPVSRLPGDMLHCIVALSSPGGCGTGVACRDCLVRGAINESIAQGAPVRRRGALELMGERGPRKLHLFVTAATVPGAETSLSLVIFEDVTEIVELRGLVPICAGCKRIRNDKDYWEQVEHYLARNLEMSFSHGMCPECINIFYPVGSPGRPAPPAPLPADTKPE